MELGNIHQRRKVKFLLNLHAELYQKNCVFVDGLGYNMFNLLWSLADARVCIRKAEADYWVILDRYSWRITQSVLEYFLD